jgi:hypothetical protein
MFQVPYFYTDTLPTSVRHIAPNPRKATSFRVYDIPIVNLLAPEFYI